MKTVTYDIIIPRISDEIIDCQIARWLKDVGDYVSEGDIIVELETEKTTIEIESPTCGILKEIYVFECEEVIDGERIGVINADEVYSEDEEVNIEDESLLSDMEYTGEEDEEDYDSTSDDELNDYDEYKIRASMPGLDNIDDLD